MAPTATSFYVTTPIYYVNDKPHLGHAYTSIAADVLKRWHAMTGHDAWMLTGTDEHGQKVFESASKRGLTPQQHVDELSVKFRELLPTIGITPDDFIRTTEARHTSVVQDVLQYLYEKGDLYADYYEGWYSTAAERFWTEKDLVDGKCPDTGQPVEWVREKNWFFRMSRYADTLRTWIADNPDFIRPDSRKNEVLGALRKEIGDLCISRPKERLPWGIALPFDPEFVTYVWFDALLNYITAIGYHPDPSKRSPTFDQRWPADYHLVGKDILTTHSVYWSTMLFALGLRPAKCLYAHGWWTVEGRKMSKTLGNVVDPHLLTRAYGTEAVRYFLLREMPFGADGDFSHKSMLERTNADLANDLGNLAHRALTMTEKWLGAVVPELDAPQAIDDELSALAASVEVRFGQEIAAANFSRALDALFELVGAGNKYIDTCKPWALNKAGDTVRLAGVMRRCLEVCRVASVLLSPVCPERCDTLARKLGQNGVTYVAVGSLDGLTAGAPVASGDPLFPRLTELPAEVQATLDAALGAEPAKGAEPAPKAKKSKKKEAPAPPAEIAYDDFAKVDLRVGTVEAASRHPDADRLLVLTVNLGEAKPRTIVAGIASVYAPETLVGQQVIVVANLAPRPLRGIESHGMVLAVTGKNGVETLAAPGIPVSPGTSVR